MDLLLPPESSNEEACLITLSTIARHYASKVSSLDAAAVETLTQDVVLECLVNLRPGKRWTDPRSLFTSVHNVVRRRANASAQRTWHGAHRKTEVVRQTIDRVYPWMAKDLAIEELRHLSFHAQSLENLSNNCRRAYRMVREHKASYSADADAVKKSRATSSSRKSRCSGPAFSGGNS